MKKALTLLSALCLCFSAAGCAQNPAPTKPSEEPGMTVGTYTVSYTHLDVYKRQMLNSCAEIQR